MIDIIMWVYRFIGNPNSLLSLSRTFALSRKGYQHFVRNRSVGLSNFSRGFVLSHCVRLCDPHRREMLRPTGHHNVAGWVGWWFGWVLVALCEKDIEMAMARCTWLGPTACPVLALQLYKLMSETKSSQIASPAPLALCIYRAGVFTEGRMMSGNWNITPLHNGPRTYWKEGGGSSTMTIDDCRCIGNWLRLALSHWAKPRRSQCECMNVVNLWSEPAVSITTLIAGVIAVRYQAEKLRELPVEIIFVHCHRFNFPCNKNQWVTLVNLG